jgi:hypothetical protein
MTRRIGAFFVFVGVVFLAVSTVLALGEQPSGRLFLAGLAASAVGVWAVIRSAGGAPLPPPGPPAGSPAAARAKPAGPAGGGPAPSEPPGPPKLRGLARLLQPRTKSRD